MKQRVGFFLGNIPIRWRITLWYTILMTALVVAVLWLLFHLSSNQMLSEAELRLQDTVERSFYEIEYEDGVLTFDDDINHLGTGISISVYDSQGNLVYGRIPANFNGAPMLIMDEIQKVEEGDGGVWYVYDTCQTIPGYGNLWVRGVVSQAEADASLHAVVRLSLIVLPFFVLLVALGGYSITRRTLGPLQDVTDTAQRISQGSDLTERIRMGPGEDEVHRLAHTFDHMMDKLQSAFESEKQFTSDVSHELRTPVSVILSQCEFALGDDAEEGERRSALQVVAAQARKMSTLIAQLLTLARTDSGRQSLHMETLNLSELAEITCEEQADAAAARNITLHTDIQPNVLLRADETMMMRLLINLIQNAVSYGREGGNIWVTLRDEEGVVQGCVRDDGIGIGAEHLNKIWNRFYQVDPSRTASRSGAGLGLPMVRWIVEAHGGSIAVESEPGKGSAFTFTFPK
ncbi:MAG: sensor histidine kinase [Candidatus Spyradocola sp.]|jgi:signal transduction histidine kinase